MKIAIPVDLNTQTSEVSSYFGRASYFLIYDEELKTSEFINNVAASSAGGAGILAAQIVVDSGAQVLLTPRCGKNAADVLEAASIKLYKSQDKLSAKDNLAVFGEDGLKELNEIHPGFHGHNVE